MKITSRNYYTAKHRSNYVVVACLFLPEYNFALVRAARPSCPPVGAITKINQIKPYVKNKKKIKKERRPNLRTREFVLETVGFRSIYIIWHLIGVFLYDISFRFTQTVSIAVFSKLFKNKTPDYLGGLKFCLFLLPLRKVYPQG